MNEGQLESTLAALLDRIESLQADKDRLQAQSAEYASTLSRMMKKVEDLQAVNDELRVKTAQPVGATVRYRERPSIMRGRTVQANVGCGPLYITLNEDEKGHPFEVFFKLGKSGSCQQSYLEALGVAMSIGLRYGADPQKFIDKFEGMRCPNPRMRDASGPTTLSCADGISQGLAKALALALPLDAPPEARAEAAIVTVAEPQFPTNENDVRETQANQMSIDIIGTFLGKQGNGNRNGNGNGHGADLNVETMRRAMQTGVGLCPKCSGPLISQGGCVQCLQQCGYVGKCS
jgi:hypothetical protein